MKILLAYDGSACSEHAVDELPRLGLPADATAVVLSIADVWLPPPGFEAAVVDAPIAPGLAMLRDKTSHLLQEAQALAETGATRLHKLFPGWRVEARSDADSPGWATVRYAEELASDLVVVGSHGRGALGRVLLGSVSQRVLTSAPCSVHVSRPREHPAEGPRRVLVAVDGSRDSITAVRELAKRAWPRDTQFRVAAVLDTRIESVVAWPGIFPSEWAMSREASPRAWICHLVEHFSRVLYDAGLKVETEVLDGEPKQALVSHAESWRSDLIVLGAHGLHHGQQRSVGSVAGAVAARAHCSVTVMRPAK